LEVAKIDEMGNLGPGDRTARRNLEDSIEELAAGLAGDDAEEADELLHRFTVANVPGTPPLVDWPARPLMVLTQSC